MSEGLRLDKWLWHARFAKTRSLAARMIEEGDVLLDGRAVKPAQIARIGSRVQLRLGRADHVVEIRALGERRGPASEARLLYEEIAVAPVVKRWVSLIED
ncbi:MAG TPA: RNA-binding S4 domain-containing protein [Stellaceae bacterium]|nr:RNA-binding S4 domain-containing protein [Stellaceae bacterium]